MSTAAKHKQRSRKTWQASAGTRKHIFSIMEGYSNVILHSRLMKQMNGGK